MDLVSNGPPLKSWKQLCNPTLFQDIIWKSNESRQESPWSRSRSCSDSSITRWFTIINFYKTLRIILNRNKTIHTIIIFRWINIESFLQEYFLNFIQIHEINKFHTYSYEKRATSVRKIRRWWNILRFWAEKRLRLVFNFFQVRFSWRERLEYKNTYNWDQMQQLVVVGGLD